MSVPSIPSSNSIYLTLATKWKLFLAFAEGSYNGRNESQRLDRYTYLGLRELTSSSFVQIMHEEQQDRVGRRVLY